MNNNYNNNVINYKKMINIIKLLHYYSNKINIIIIIY